MPMRKCNACGAEFADLEEVAKHILREKDKPHKVLRGWASSHLKKQEKKAGNGNGNGGALKFTPEEAEEMAILKAQIALKQKKVKHKELEAVLAGYAKIEDWIADLDYREGRIAGREKAVARGKATIEAGKGDLATREEEVKSQTEANADKEEELEGREEALATELRAIAGKWAEVTKAINQTNERTDDKERQFESATSTIEYKAKSLDKIMKEAFEIYKLAFQRKKFDGKSRERLGVLAGDIRDLYNRGKAEAHKIE